ncbi:MAG: glutamate decarboxylase [Bacillota bacterium]
MWTVVYVASSWEEAEAIKDRLAQDGLLVMLRACGSYGERVSKEVELLVPEIEVGEAQAIIMQMVGTARAW